MGTLNLFQNLCLVYITSRANFGNLLNFVIRGKSFGTNLRRRLSKNFWISLQKLLTCSTRTRQRRRASSVTQATAAWEHVCSKRPMQVCGYLFRLPHASLIPRNLNIVLMNWNSVGQSQPDMTSPINASALLDNTAVTENLLDFATNLNSPSTPAPTIVEMAPTNPPRSRPLLRYTRLQTVSNQARRNRQGPPRTPLQSIANSSRSVIADASQTGPVSSLSHMEFVRPRRNPSFPKIKRR